MTGLALDTSVAVPLLLQDHREHDTVVRWWDGRPVCLCGHALIETYSVLTRLPGGVRLSPDVAAEVIARRFEAPLLMGPASTAAAVEALAARGIAGGAVYDGLVALAALEHDATLATRDGRAEATYHALGVNVTVVG